MFGQQNQLSVISLAGLLLGILAAVGVVGLIWLPKAWRAPVGAAACLGLFCVTVGHLSVAQSPLAPVVQHLGQAAGQGSPDAEHIGDRRGRPAQPCLRMCSADSGPPPTCARPCGVWSRRRTTCARRR